MRDFPWIPALVVLAFIAIMIYVGGLGIVLAIFILYIAIVGLGWSIVRLIEYFEGYR